MVGGELLDESKIHNMTKDQDSDVRLHAACVLSSAFSHITDKSQATKDLLAMTRDENSSVRECVASALGSTFPYVTNKSQAWKDLLTLTKDQNSDVRMCAAKSIGSAFLHVTDKSQAWKDLITLTKYQDSHVRWRAAGALGSAFPQIRNKSQATKVLLALTKDRLSYVRAYANHSLGKVHIFKATEADEENFRKELEKALNFFEKSSKEQLYYNPASFCLPFYRSFYSITCKKGRAEAEIQNYLAEAKSAVEGSESKEKLIEVIESLSNALKEVQKTTDFHELKQDLNAYRKYCDRAANLLESIEDEAPGATKLIRKGIPIIDDRIKEILSEIQDKAITICRQTRGTAFENLGKDIYNAGQNILNVRDPIGLEKTVQNMHIALLAICAKMPEEDKGDACEILRRANDEPCIEDKIDLINMVLSKIPSQIGKGKTMPKISNIVNQYGPGSKYYSESEDKSINITGLISEFENLKILIERDYEKHDKQELLQTVELMKQSCNDLSKKSWLKEKMGWILTKTSEVSSISSLVITLLQNRLI